MSLTIYYRSFLHLLFTYNCSLKLSSAFNHKYRRDRLGGKGNTIHKNNIHSTCTKTNNITDLQHDERTCARGLSSLRRPQTRRGRSRRDRSFLLVWTLALGGSYRYGRQYRCRTHFNIRWTRSNQTQKYYSESKTEFLD